MGHLLDHAPALAADVVDAATAVLSAAWPRSLAAREVERLANDGYAVGEICDVDFSLAFDWPAQMITEIEELANAQEKRGEPLLLGRPDAVKHLELKCFFADSFTLGKIDCSRDHLWIVGGYTVIDSTAQK